VSLRRVEDPGMRPLGQRNLRESRGGHRHSQRTLYTSREPGNTVVGPVAGGQRQRQRPAQPARQSFGISDEELGGYHDSNHRVGGRGGKRFWVIISSIVVYFGGVFCD
jgi:hypothetical protein